MKPVDSMIKNHDPANGRFGDCYRACIASLLEMPAADVPHFCDGIDDDNADDAPEAVEAASRFVFEQTGCRLVEFPVEAGHLDTLLQNFGSRFEGIHYLLLGQSTRGTNHQVIGCGSKIVHDPTYGDPHGITGPARDGFFWVGMIVRP